MGVRQADRTIAEVAAANGGRYTVDAHLRHDPSATEAYAETHVRRLEAMRRLTRNVEREPDGTWVVSPNHFDRAAAYEAARAKDRPVTIDMLSPQPLEKLVDAEAATWLDRELVAASPEPLRDTGFGRDARVAQTQRRQWLIGSAVIHDIKGENWTLTAGLRSRFSHCLLFNPTDAASAKYNPLLEVRRGENEVRDVQNIADVPVDPNGLRDRE